MSDAIDIEFFPDALNKVVEDGIDEILRETPFPVECPECGTSFEVTASTAECPNCGLPIDVKVG